MHWGVPKRGTGLEAWSSGQVCVKGASCFVMGSLDLYVERLDCTVGGVAGVGMRVPLYGHSNLLERRDGTEKRRKWTPLAVLDSDPYAPVYYEMPPHNVEIPLPAEKARLEERRRQQNREHQAAYRERKKAEKAAAIEREKRDKYMKEAESTIIPKGKFSSLMGDGPAPGQTPGRMLDDTKDEEDESSTSSGLEEPVTKLEAWSYSFDEAQDWPSFVTEFERGIQDVNRFRSDVKISEDMKQVMLLKALGSRFKNFVTQVGRGRVVAGCGTGPRISYDELLTETQHTWESILRSDEAVIPSDAKSFHAGQKRRRGEKPGGECKFHPDKYHGNDNCWKQHPELRPEKQTKSGQKPKSIAPKTSRTYIGS
nr:hypothetical protein CFP56_73751 [Quercus suber]